jgi:hypothetical protein
MAETITEPGRDASGRFVAARSPERVVLAEAIARCSAMGARISRIEAALKRAGDTRLAAYCDESAAEDRSA